MKIPAAVIKVVSDVLYNQYSHNELNELFPALGAPGDPPDGNKWDKTKAWLRRCDSSPDVDAWAVLGGLLEEYMEVPDASNEEGREQVHQVLSQYEREYLRGGIFPRARASGLQRLDELVRARDLDAVQVELNRAHASVERDPAAALTAACAMVESVLKTYITDRDGLSLPSKQTIKPLWAVVRDDLKLDPARVEDRDLKQILSGLAGVLDGLGALRTHAGSAHGKGRLRYTVQPRHARLAVGAASTLVVFLVETWGSDT